MSALEDLFVENIRLSELRGRKKEQILDLLSSAASKDLSFQKVGEDEVLVTYRVSLQSDPANRDELLLQRHTPLSKYVEEKQRESVLQRPQVGRRTRGARQALAGPPSGASFVRGKLWALKFIQEIYGSRFALFSTEISTPEGKLESFSSFVFSFIKSKFGLGSLVKQTTQELLQSVKFYSKTDRAVELFGLFLTPYYSVRDLMFFLHVRSIVMKEMFSKERPQSILRKTTFEMKIPLERLKHLTKKALMYQPKLLKRNCFRELRRPRHYYRQGRKKRRKKDVLKLRSGSLVPPRGNPGVMSINTFLWVLLEEYRKIAPDHYTLLPLDVPFYHRVRDKSVVRYVILRTYKKGMKKPGQVQSDAFLFGSMQPIHGQQEQEQDDGEREAQRLEGAPQYLGEDQIQDHIRQENYHLSFEVDRKAQQQVADEEFEARMKAGMGSGVLPTADQDVQELLRMSGTAHERLLFPSTRRGRREAEAASSAPKGKSVPRPREEEALDELDALNLPTFNDNLEGAALAEKQKEKRRRNADLDDVDAQRQRLRELLGGAGVGIGDIEGGGGGGGGGTSSEEEPVVQSAAAAVDSQRSMQRVGKLIDMSHVSGRSTSMSRVDKQADLSQRVGKLIDLQENDALRASFLELERAAAARGASSSSAADRDQLDRDRMDDLPMALPPGMEALLHSDDDDDELLDDQADEAEIEALIRKVEAETAQDDEEPNVVGDVKEALERLDEVAPDGIDRPRPTKKKRRERRFRGASRTASDVRVGTATTRRSQVLERDVDLPSLTAGDDLRISSFRFLEDEDDILTKKKHVRKSPIREGGIQTLESSLHELEERDEGPEEDTQSLIFKLKRELDLNSLVFNMVEPETSSDEDR